MSLISGISGISYGFGSYGYTPSSFGVPEKERATAADSVNPNTGEVEKNAKIKGIDGKTECQSCKNRKYVDGSDEMVSFKSAAKISADSAYSKVSAHEQEHVSNAYKKAEEKGGKVLQASVTIKRAICPECGRSYVAGGETTTRIKYPNSDPYSNNQKSSDYAGMTGSNIDAAV